MNCIFIAILFGHLFGDYLFQNNWMALNKKNDFLALAVHCCIYALFVIMFTSQYIKDEIISSYVWYLYIVLSHAILDGTNLIEKWFNLIKSRSYSVAQDEFFKCFISSNIGDTIKGNYAISYTAIVQTVADNTIHLFLMYYGYVLMKGWNWI